MMKTLLLVGLLPISSPAVEPHNDLARKDLAAFQGQWKLVWVERNGQKIELQSEVNHTIRGNKWFIGDVEACVIQLDPGCNPKVIDYLSSIPESKGVKVEGIYRIDGDSMVWCWEGTEGAANRPVEFRTMAGSNRIVYGFSRIREQP